MSRYLFIAVVVSSMSVLMIGKPLALAQCDPMTAPEMIQEDCIAADPNHLLCIQYLCSESGACLSIGPIDCNTPPDECHDPGTCNEMTGECEYPPSQGGPCSDGNACTQGEFCQNGVCTGGQPVTCFQSDQCHDAGTCDPMTGLCSNPVKDDGTPCTDGNACTASVGSSDVCMGGVCTGDPLTGNACDDGSTCTEPDTCQSDGTCRGVPVSNGTTCDDNNACTQMDACQAGVCTSGSSVVCTASDECHDVGTCDTTTGICSNPAKADGTPCDNNTVCDGLEICEGGICTGGEPLDCDDVNVCTVDGCDPIDGCIHTSVQGCCTSDTHCHDMNLCTTNEQCVENGCISEPVICDDGDSCTDDGCEPEMGCTFTANWMVRCDDSNPCTDDSCVSETGDCINPFNLCGSVIDTACPCDGPWENHGQYVSCVAQQVKSLRQANYITKRQGGAIVSRAAQSYCSF